MQKLTLTAIFILLFSSLYSQEDLLIFKKGNKSIEKFWKGAFIAFQLENKTWEKGELVKIKNDSFYIRPRVIKYSLMRTDTFYYPVKGFVLSDIYAMPKRGVLIDFVNGRFQISRTGGHLHFYWIKSGFIFRVGGAGFALLGLANGSLLNVPFGAAVFGAGVLMKKMYKLTIRLKGKYKMETFKLSAEKNPK
jgi:hypothetical protein